MLERWVGYCIIALLLGLLAVDFIVLTGFVGGSIVMASIMLGGFVSVLALSHIVGTLEDKRTLESREQLLEN